MSTSKILFFLCISFVVGILLESFVKIPQIFIWGFLFAGILLICSGFLPGDKKPLILNFAIIFGFCALFLTMGILRMQISEFNIANDKLSKLNEKGSIVLTGIISGEPDVRDTSQKLDVKVGNSTILVSTYRYPEYHYLDKIKLTGKLETPMVTDTFNYQNYLMKDHIYSVMNFAKIELIGKASPNFLQKIYSVILFVKQKLEQSIQNNFLPPHSLILEGIIFGNNKNMTADLRNQLNAAGLRFLTAISGVHVIILSAILINLLMFLRLRRNYAFYSSIFLIWLYVVITGFTTSGIRAAIMGSIFIFAGALGRQNTSSRTIVLAAALMLLQNPLLLIYDVGFHLSFLACLGIIYLKPSLNFFPDIISTTFAAQIFTLPIMIFNFGTISLAAPITSLLILPVMPAILSFGFLFSIFAAVSKILGWVLFVPTFFLIEYFLKIMQIFSQPWMVKNITNVSWVWILLAYLIIFSATYFLRKKYSKSFV